jgi:puromycin-sensitive aminopeptidase
MKIKNVRLSKNVVPTEYELQLRPDLENFTFEGVETISLEILKPTKTLTLHSKELEIMTASISGVFGKISYDVKSETATFTFPKNIPMGKVKLTLVFKGILNDKMRGFYKSSYVFEGKVHHIATTQLEATDARRAFPCFDEPAQKAVFHMSLVVPKGKTVISNTLPISNAPARNAFSIADAGGIHESGYEVIKFSPTPKMSTYLLAFIVGDFEYIEKKSNRGVVVRVYTTPGKTHQAKFALDVTVKCLEFYEKYFDIPYPLKTLDMIAIPDFQSLAMENWGAITFREIGLLVDENNTSTSSKERIAEVIAHELAHQWFGNLVTMEWWTHLWLNEGFASYIPYLVTEKLFPEWNIWERFTNDTQGIALRLDSLLNTHPIEVEVHHPDEIGEIFDEVSYSKGASVIRMLADYLGEKDFRDGLRYYLKKHSYKNTETIHLWQAFEKVSGKPVAKMMHNWTSRPGYPVIKAEVRNGKVEMTQSRFFASPASAKKNKDKTKWMIPVIFGEDKINFGESGFFRTAYSKELLENLRESIQNKSLPSWDRLGIIRDLFALSEAGIIPTTDALEFLSAYKNEDNYTVLVEIATGLSKLSKILSGTGLSPQLDKVTRNLFSPIAEKLTWNKKSNENYSDALLRPLALSMAGESGDEKVISQAKNKFNSLMRGAHVEPDIRGTVYRLAVMNGGIKEYNFLIKKYKSEPLHEEKNRIGGALGYFKQNKILCDVVHFSLSKDVRPQDTIGILSIVGANPLGRDIWLKCLKQNWKLLVSRYGDGGHYLSRLIKAISGSAEEKHFKTFKKFFATHEAPGAKRSIEQVLERLEGNILWLKRDKKIIEKFLKQI